MDKNNKFFRLHPENTHYFIFKNEPLILITSSEHYGAVINLDFDYITYLDMLKEKGFKLTRLFTFYREQPNSCSGLEATAALTFSELGEQNTLAPSMESYIAPWLRSSVPGNFDGGNKFDLEKWDNNYFTRLKDFCKEADKRGIIIEITLFGNFYNNNEDGPWKVSPINSINNINGIGNIEFYSFTGLVHKDIVAVQERLVKKLVLELKDFENIYYEICNEPNPMPKDPQLTRKQIAQWHNHFVSLITKEEENYPNKHLIAVGDPNEHYDLSKVAVLNFHYAEWTINGLENFYKYNLPISFDETLTGIVSWNSEMDFDGRRKEAWEFIMKGCSVYDYLDFTIATDDPTGTGTATFPHDQHYNGEIMRLYLKHLNDFMHSLDFVKMKPDNSVVKSVHKVASVNALVEKGRAYVLYINGNSLKYITIDLAEGSYNIEWFNPRTGKVDLMQEGLTGGSKVTLEVPLFESDIVLKMIAK